MDAQALQIALLVHLHKQKTKNSAEQGVSGLHVHVCAQRLSSAGQLWKEAWEMVTRVASEEGNKRWEWE